MKASSGTAREGEVGGLGAEQSSRYGWVAEVIRGGRVLDAGCGVGRGAALLAAAAAEVVGVDISGPSVEDARRSRGRLAEFLVADFRELPFEDGSFDHVLCFEALCEVARPEQAIGELCRVLRPGGLLFVSAPDPAVYPAGNPLHRSELAPADLERVLRARFGNVALHPEYARFATLLGAGTSPARVSEHRDGPGEGAPNVVAVASEGDIPPAPSRLVLGGGVEYEAQRRALEEWQERAIAAEAEAFVLRRELRRLQR